MNSYWAQLNGFEWRLNMRFLAEIFFLRTFVMEEMRKKFRQNDKIFEVFGNKLRVNSVFWYKCYRANFQFSKLPNRYWTHNVAIWSHWIHLICSNTIIKFPEWKFENVFLFAKSVGQIATNSFAGFGTLWWSRGQLARLLLRVRILLSPTVYSVKFVLEKTEN